MQKHKDILNVLHFYQILKNICLFAALLLFLLPSFALYSQESAATIQLSTQKRKIDGHEYFVHIIEKGQTLFSIARAYGSRYQDAIYKMDIDKIAIGDTVWILSPTPPEETTYKSNFLNYEVKKGETLYSISRQFSLKEADIVELNPQLKTEPLKTGQIIKIKQDNKGKSSSETEQIKGGVINVKPIADGDSIEDMVTVEPEDFIVKDLVDPNTIHVALLMPFYLDKAGEISISKVDIEQKRKRSYKSFQFIHFYESILLGIEKLEELGFSVKLYVYDVPENDTKAVETIFSKPELQKVDFIIALLYQNAFETAAKYAKRTNTFIINPPSSRNTITDKKPYVFKIYPSEKALATATISLIENNFENPNIILIHSGNQSETPIFTSFKAKLEEKKTIPYTLFNWSTSTSFSAYLKPEKNNIVISIYNQGADKNQLYASNLINRLSAIKKNTPTLFADKSLLDYESLYPSFQRVGFFFSDNFYLSNNNPNQKAFLDKFRETYKIEPDYRYASAGYDIMLYFVSGLQSNGKKFWTKPSIPSNVRLLNPFFFKQIKPEDGFENNRIIFYHLENYEIIPALQKSKSKE